MGGAVDTIKDYLVGLGFVVDAASYNKIQSTVSNLTRSIESNASAMTTSYVKAGAAVGGVLASMAVSIGGLINQLADADMGYHKFALRMHMAHDTAKQLKIVLDAMGESQEDIAWIPELRLRYFQLMKEASEMEPPAEAEKRLRNIRDFKFEFTRLKVEMTYGLQHIGSYLIQYLSGPLKEGKGWFSSLNDTIRKNMPEWTEMIGKWLTNIIQLGSAGAKTIGQLVEAFKLLWNALPDWAKWIAGSSVFFKLFTMMGPFGQILTFITGLTAALDDLDKRMTGGTSSAVLAPIWDMMIVAIDKMVKGMIVIGMAWDRLNGKGDMSKSFREEVDDTIGYFWDTKVNGREINSKTIGRDVAFAVGGEAALNPEDRAAYNAAKAGKATVVQAEAASQMVMNTAGTQAPFLRKPTSKEDFANQLDTLTNMGAEDRNKQRSALLESMSGVESKGFKRGKKYVKGDEYFAKTKLSSAYGKYQITKGTWEQSLKRMKLPLDTPFTPENQELVAQNMMDYYLNKYSGDENLVRVAWYEGEGFADRIVAGEKMDLNKRHFYKDKTTGKISEGPSVGEHVYKGTGGFLGGGKNLQDELIKSGRTQYGNTLSTGEKVKNVDMGGFAVNIYGDFKGTPKENAEQIYQRFATGIPNWVDLRTGIGA